MTFAEFQKDSLSLLTGFGSLTLFTAKVKAFNLAIYYNPSTDGDELSPRRLPPFLVRVTTLGRYPQLVASSRFDDFKDAYRFLYDEMRLKYSSY